MLDEVVTREEFLSSAYNVADILEADDPFAALEAVFDATDNSLSLCAGLLSICLSATDIIEQMSAGEVSYRDFARGSRTSAQAIYDSEISHA